MALMSAKKLAFCNLSLMMQRRDEVDNQPLSNRVLADCSGTAARSTKVSQHPAVNRRYMLGAQQQSLRPKKLDAQQDTASKPLKSSGRDFG
jgi:hypothetical protein